MGRGPRSVHLLPWVFDGLVGCVNAVHQRACLYAARSEPDLFLKRMTRDLHRRLSEEDPSDSGFPQFVAAPQANRRADRFENIRA